MGYRKFEVVKEFIYLGIQITANNKISVEIRRCITNGLSKDLRSQMFSRTTKVKLYNTFIVPVSIYDTEAWTFTYSNERMLDMLERKVLKPIYDPLYVDGEWRTLFV